MSSSSCNNKGLSVVEVLIATFLVMIGVMALISMQPQGWLLSGKSDFLGRAAEILHRQLEAEELLIMAGDADPVHGPAATTVWASGEEGDTGQTGVGDIAFTVRTTVANANPPWLIKVTVEWQDRGQVMTISESRLVTRQGAFK